LVVVSDAMVVVVAVMLIVSDTIVGIEVVVEVVGVGVVMKEFMVATVRSSCCGSCCFGGREGTDRGDGGEVTLHRTIYARGLSQS
jgi:hypothetical protein